MMNWFINSLNRRDLLVITILYAFVVGSFRLAFQGFTEENVAGLFISFGVVGLLILGIAGPVFYAVWVRRRPLDELGVGAEHWKTSLALGVVLGGIQFAFILAGYELPDYEDWVPLLVMSITVGLFEAVFFRGFIQNRLEASFGIVPSIVGAAGLYSLYHFGYQMGAGEMLFLFGLGVAYAVIFRLTRNILILWPFLIPMGSFYNNVEAGDIDLPWASIAGFVSVLVHMGLMLLIGYRRGAHFRQEQKVPVSRSGA